MSLLVVLLAAAGLSLVFSGVTAPPTAKRRDPLRPLRELSEGAGMRSFSPLRVVASTVAAFVMVLLVVAGITSSIVIATVASIAAAGLPIGMLRSRRDKRRRMFREAWPDALAGLIAAVRSGSSLPEACVALGERGPVELMPGFSAFAATYRSSGSFSASLARLRDELADPIGDRVVVALEVAHEVGGSDLVRVLRTLGDFVRDDLRIRKEIQARWSWTVTAARVAAAAPWLVLVMMATRPEAAAAYDSPTGLVVITGGAAVTLIGYRLMLRAGRLPEDRRLS